MQVIFGMENLIALVDSLLEPGERLGRAALSAREAEPAARDRILALAGALAERLDLQIETEGVGRDLTVWLYGPRSRVSLLSQVAGED